MDQWNVTKRRAPMTPPVTDGMRAPLTPPVLPTVLRGQTETLNGDATPAASSPQANGPAVDPDTPAHRSTHAEELEHYDANVQYETI